MLEAPSNGTAPGESGSKLRALQTLARRRGTGARKRASGLRAVPWGLLAALVFVAFSSLWAAAAQTPDYSAGVKKMFELGLPDVRQAKYVKVESISSRWGGSGLMDRGPKMTGNAWLLELKTNGTASVVMNQLTVTELMPAKAAEQPTKARLETLMANAKPGHAPYGPMLAGVEANVEALESLEELGLPQTGNWKEADLQADLRSWLEYLPKVGGELDFQFKQKAVSLFLFAAHVHRRGHTAEANQIMALLFQKVGDSRKLLSAAMSRIANEQYQQVYAEFERTGDWAQYLSAMEGLLGRFGLAWRDAPLVERVAGMVRKQLDQKSAPGLSGAGWSEADLRIATLLAQSNTVIDPRHPVLNGLGWLANADRRDPRQKPPGPLELIQQRGARVVPLLVALLQDEWLVRATSGARRQFSFLELEEEALSTEGVDNRLEDSARPWSRGQIARRILEPLVLERAEEFDQDGRPTPEELARKSRAWAARHTTDDRAELLRQLLAEGRQEPLHLLMDSPEPADRAAVESYLLQTNRLADNLTSVTLYAQQHGLAVKPFLRQYLAELKKLRSLLPKQELARADARYVKQREAQLRAEVEVLEDLASDQTAEQMLQAMTAPDAKWDRQQLERSGAALGAKLAQEDPDHALTLLLRSCLRSKDEALAEYLLECANQLRRPPALPKQHRWGLSAQAAGVQARDARRVVEASHGPGMDDGLGPGVLGVGGPVFPSRGGVHHRGLLRRSEGCRRRRPARGVPIFGWQDPRGDHPARPGSVGRPPRGRTSALSGQNQSHPGTPDRDRPALAREHQGEPAPDRRPIDPR